ncbi:MAG: hypothetical protein AAFR39_13040 [Pseudomonadota bacterium]
MQEALFVLTVLGCNDAATQCQRMETEQVQYVSLEDCYADSEAMMVANSDAPFPVFLARCDTLGSQPTEAAINDVVMTGSLEPPVLDETETATSQESTQAAEVQEPVKPGVWYRVRPRNVISTVTKPAKGLVEGAGNVASSAVEGAGNVLKKTGQTIKRLNPLN